jgi:circadian clock protein KaiC
MIEEQLPALVKARSDYLIKTRIVVDPLTPVIWATKDKLLQRELLGNLFYTVKNLGVVVATVEEHTKPGETIGEDVLTPVYLADGVIHMDYYPVGGAFNRTLQIIKMRGTKHGESVYPFIFVRGAGIVVRSTPLELKEEKQKDYGKIFDDAIETAKMLKAPPALTMKLENIKKWWNYPYSPEEIIEIIFDSYGLKVR